MRKAYAIIPFYLAVPILYWLVFQMAGYPMYWAAFGIGVLGWWIAYILRIPISLLLKDVPPSKGQFLIGLFSGPLEEGLRFAALLITGVSMHWALSLGQGWAAIEVVFTIINVIALISVKYRTDEKAMQAKEMLRSIGNNLDGSLFWGVIERLFASGFHIGSTLLIARNPWLVIAMVPIHTAYNLILVGIFKKTQSPLLVEVFAGVVGVVTLTAGLLVSSL